MVKRKSSEHVCKWCGASIDPMRSTKTKFCNASHRALWWRRGQLPKERCDKAEKAIDRLAQLLAYDETNVGGTKALKWLKELIDRYLEDGWQLPLEGVE